MSYTVTKPIDPSASFKSGLQPEYVNMTNQREVVGEYKSEEEAEIQAKNMGDGAIIRDNRNGTEREYRDGDFHQLS
jgi:hypothetical protein